MHESALSPQSPSARYGMKMRQELSVSVCGLGDRGYAMPMDNREEIALW
jgi:hypothetical protein